MPTASNRIRRGQPLLGTFVEIDAAGSVPSKVHEAIDAAFEAVATVHRLMSFHDPDSDVSRLNREASNRPVKVNDWTFRVLEAAIEMHRLSNGVFDVAIAPILQTMGLLPRLNDDAPISMKACPGDAIELLEGQRVRFRHPHIRIDLGGIAKGFAVDRALEALRLSDALSGGLVNAGGDLAIFGRESQWIHIRHPRDPSRMVCRVEVNNEAMASTARRLDPVHSTNTTASAVIDPRSRAPADGIDGVSVRAPSCMVADALTKIVMIAGTDATGLLELYSASALLISADDVQISSDWQHAVHLAA
jgi:thiamine biosynthesis lipoprotein